MRRPEYRFSPTDATMTPRELLDCLQQAVADYAAQQREWEAAGGIQVRWDMAVVYVDANGQHHAVDRIEARYGCVYLISPDYSPPSEESEAHLLG